MRSHVMCARCVGTSVASKREGWLPWADPVVFLRVSLGYRRAAWMPSTLGKLRAYRIVRSAGDWASMRRPFVS